VAMERAACGWIRHSSCVLEVEKKSVVEHYYFYYFLCHDILIENPCIWIGF
jgi:hypothetical protein